MKSTPLRLPVAGDRLDDLDDGAARTSLAVQRRRERDHERSLGRHRRSDGRAEEIQVRRLCGRRSSNRLHRCVRLECRVHGGNSAVADSRCRGLLAHDHVPECLDLLPTGRSGENPVLPRRRGRERGHVDVLRVGLRPARNTDRLERRGRLRERLLLEASRDPDPGRGLLDQLRLLVDDQEGDAILAGTVVGCPGNDGDGLAPFTPERLQGPSRRCGRRRISVATRAGASTPDEHQRTTERDEGRSRAIHHPSLAALLLILGCVIQLLTSDETVEERRSLSRDRADAPSTHGANRRPAAERTF